MSSLYYEKKITSCSCLLESELKVIFHRLAQGFILLFKLVADKSVLSTTETSSVKSLAFV